MLKRLEPTLKLLPDPVKRAVKRASAPVDVVLRARYRRGTGDHRPMPPAKLRARVGAGIWPEVFNGGGLELLQAVEQALRANGRSLREARVVYDWGCGSGRLLRHLDGAVGPSTRIIGTDIDEEAVAWAARAWPHMTVRTNGFSPQLPVEDGEVDVLISSSIFTHLAQRDQDTWLAEVQRVLAPDGIALVTTAGPQAYAQLREGDDVSRSREFMERMARMPDLEQAGFVFEPYEVNRWNREDFTGVTGVYGMTFHSADYVRTHWSRWLRVLERREAATNSGQDLYVLARADVAAAASAGGH